MSAFILVLFGVKAEAGINSLGEAHEAGGSGRSP